MSCKRLLIVAIVVLGIYIPSGAQVINTIAGNGNIGYSGDGGPAAMAQLNALGVTIGPNGNIYIPDAANNRVRMIDADTVINTIAGTGTAGYNVDSGDALTTLLYYPSSVAIDTAGNIYIADQRNQRIRKVDTGGVMTTIAGNGLTGHSGDDSAAVNAKLNNPVSVATDTFGNVYVADYGNNCIRKINAAGIITTIAGTGVAGHTGDGAAATAATLDSPTCVRVDPAGNIYIADRYNNCIRMVDTDGVINNFAGDGSNGFGGDGGSATAAQLAHPYGIALDKNGNLYIADEENQRIRRVNTSGIIKTIAGSGTLSFCGDGGDPLQACLNHPKGVAVDDAGNVYIADAFNNRIREITGILGVKNRYAQAAAIKLFPDPTSGAFTITGNIETSNGSANMEVMDIIGHLVASQTVHIENNNLNAEVHIPTNTPHGIYLFRISTDKQTTTLRFVLD